jgi:hypothetical protein
MRVASIRKPLIEGQKSYKKITDDIVGAMAGKPGRLWYVGISISFTILVVVWKLFILADS